MKGGEGPSVRMKIKAPFCTCHKPKERHMKFKLILPVDSKAENEKYPSHGKVLLKIHQKKSSCRQDKGPLNH
jgi:hypothetical protein